jgi:adenylate cyclase
LERRLAAILAADVVGYTRLMGWDEAGTLHRLTALREQIVQPLIARHRGRVVKLMGDGLLVEFSSVVDAIACAAAWQERVVEHEAEGDVAKQVKFRIGINVGDVIVEGDDIHGDGVNIAARLEGLAEPGGICLSEDAYRQARGKTEVEFQDLGERTLKNVSEPVRVYRVATRVSGTVSAEPAGEPRPLPDKPSIAVLPFTNMSGDPEQEYFSDGITEDIITGLAKVSGLFIVARNSVFTYKGKAVKIQQVSQELGVRYVLEGSVRKAGNRVRITAQLIDGDTGGHIWAERYDRDLSDVFHIQDEISQSIVEAAKVATAPKERSDIQKTPTTNMEAYQFYLRDRKSVV